MTDAIPVVIKPQGTAILLKPDPVYESSIIAAPETAQHEHPESGIIIRQGSHVDPELYPLGQRVGIRTHSGYEYEENGDPVILIDVSEVRCFIDDEVEGAPV